MPAWVVRGDLEYSLEVVRCIAKVVMVIKGCVARPW